MEERLLRLSQIIPHILPISKSSWWQGVKDKKYPQPIKLSARTTCWRASDIARLIEARATDTGKPQQ
jgi:predicted DNA-binding transcriptional regulator AlpA